MKKLFAITLAMVLAITLAACGGNAGGGSENPPADRPTGSVTLESMKQAARAAGYEVVEGGFVHGGGKAGFEVVIPKEHGDLQTPIIEFANASAAKEYAQSIDAYGYQVCIVNGKFLAMAGANEGEIEDQAEYDFLANLINGRPLV